MQLHASCCARSGQGLLITGPPGSGKSSLALRLLRLGFTLVADDRVLVDGLTGWAPTALAGILEVRGVGLLRLPYLRRARLALVLTLGDEERLPGRAVHAATGLPLVSLRPYCPTLPERASMALRAALNCGPPVAGAFA